MRQWAPLFVGLDLDTDPWDHSTFSQNRKRRFTESGLLSTQQMG